MTDYWLSLLYMCIIIHVYPKDTVYLRYHTVRQWGLSDSQYLTVYDSLFRNCLYLYIGVYKHVSGDFLGGHAIKILGWGTENGTPYWYVSICICYWLCVYCRVHTTIYTFINMYRTLAGGNLNFGGVGCGK